MVVVKAETEQDDTREALLAAAHRQFAERGYYGASIAQIAGEIGLTKQALLYHFKRKADLYNEVLRRIAAGHLAMVRSDDGAAQTPAKRFEETITKMYHYAQQNPLDTAVLMRELLDDHRRDAPSSEWFFRTLLDELVALLDAVPGQSGLPKMTKLSRIYSIMSAIQYFTASEATLRRFYDDDGFDEITKAYPKELCAMLKRLLEGGEG